MIQKVYKVVYPLGGELQSTYAPIKFKRIYAEGKTVRPVRGTKLFCFLDLKDAIMYAEAIGDCYVYEAEATNVEKGGWLQYTIEETKKLQEAFSEGLKPHEFGYESSSLCSSIKLIKKINKNENRN